MQKRICFYVCIVHLQHSYHVEKPGECFYFRNYYKELVYIITYTISVTHIMDEREGTQ